MNTLASGLTTVLNTTGRTLDTVLTQTGFKSYSRLFERRVDLAHGNFPLRIRVPDAGDLPPTNRNIQSRAMQLFVVLGPVADLFMELYFFGVPSMRTFLLCVASESLFFGADGIRKLANDFAKKLFHHDVAIKLQAILLQLWAISGHLFLANTIYSSIERLLSYYRAISLPLTFPSFYALFINLLRDVAHLRVAKDHLDDLMNVSEDINTGIGLMRGQVFVGNMAAFANNAEQQNH